MQNLRLTFKTLIADLHMSYNDVMEADYYDLMETLNTKEMQQKKQIVDLADFVESLEKGG